MSEITTAPEFMIDADGAPIAIRHDQARSPADALRRVVEDYGFDWYLEDLSGSWNEAEDQCRYDVAELRKIVAPIKVVWMRPAETDDEKAGAFGEDAWYWCDEDHPNAVAYWNIEGGQR